MSTPHNRAKKGDFAKTVLMPGDPLRAKFIAETFLKDCKLVNDVRGMLGYTGYYNDKKISVMGSGMGIPSMAIYATELYTIYDVENIIRVGTCGGYDEKLNVGDTILAQGACTNSAFTSQFDTPGVFAPLADFKLLLNAYNKAQELNINVEVGNVLSSDLFFDNNTDGEQLYKKWLKMGVLAVEMETAGLYTVAAKEGKRALSILTVSDHMSKEEYTTPEQREKTFTDMMKIALEIG